MVSLLGRLSRRLSLLFARSCGEEELLTTIRVFTIGNNMEIDNRAHVMRNITLSLSFARSDASFTCIIVNDIALICIRCRRPRRRRQQRAKVSLVVIVVAVVVIVIVVVAVVVAEVVVKRAGCT